jgi:hypothetical protein
MRAFFVDWNKIYHIFFVDISIDASINDSIYQNPITNRNAHIAQSLIFKANRGVKFSNHEHSWLLGYISRTEICQNDHLTARARLLKPSTYSGPIVSSKAIVYDYFRAHYASMVSKFEPSLD